MNTKQAYDWLSYVEKVLAEQDSIPLLGAAPPFPFDEFALHFRKHFDIQDFAVKMKEICWRSLEDLWTGLGENITYINFVISPLEGKLTLAIANEDLNRITSWILSKQAKSVNLSNTALREGFAKFFTIESFKMVESLEFLDRLSPRLISDNTRPQRSSLAMDIAMEGRGATAWCRLILSPEFRQAWVKHFQQRPHAFSEEMKDSLEVTMHLFAGKIDISFATWSTIAIGDFLPLDHSFYDPFLKKGRLVLDVGGRPIFKVKVKPDGLKLVEYPFYYEEETVMDEDEMKKKQESGVEEELFEDLAQEESNEELADNDTDKKQVSTDDFQVEESKSSISVDDIPLNIAIEVKRFKMSARKLLELRPGNLLELEVHPDAPVSLVVNGKQVGKAELIRIGEVLGVRILELG